MSKMIDHEHYEFAFVSGARGSLDQRLWAEEALQFFDRHDVKPKFLSGKQKLITVPKDPQVLLSKMTARSAMEVLAGENPHHSDPMDGWGITISCDSDRSEIAIGRYVGAQPSVSALASFARECSKLASMCMSVVHGYAYCGSFPKDLFFGLGILRGKASVPLREWFNEETVGNWFRAMAWGTNKDYLRDVFPVNLLSGDLMDRSLDGETLREIALRAGSVEALDNGLWLWQVPSDSDRRRVADELAKKQFLIARHAPNQYSQCRTSSS